jgi:hypothetical protein
MQHDWIPSTLGHGETMCRRCFITNREAAAIGEHECSVSPPDPTAANQNTPQRQWTQDEIDHDNEYEEDEEYDDSEDCGRWINGRLSPQCRLAGTEWCDWECPIGCR